MESLYISFEDHYLKHDIDYYFSYEFWGVLSGQIEIFLSINQIIFFYCELKISDKTFLKDKGNTV